MRKYLKPVLLRSRKVLKMKMTMTQIMSIVKKRKNKIKGKVVLSKKRIQILTLQLPN